MLPIFITMTILSLMLFAPIGLMFPILGGIIGAAAGGLAKAAKALFSGKAREARQQRRAEKVDIALGLESGTTPLGLSKRKQKKEEEKKQESAKEAAGGLMEIVKKYWWIGAIVAGIFFLPKLLGKNPGTRRRRSSSNSGSTFSRRMQAAKRRKARTRK